MRRTLILSIILTFPVVALMGSARVYAAEPPVEIPPELILQRFTVAKDGDALLVPVRIDGKDHMFLVDTGCTYTVFDAPLLRGAQKKTVLVNTPSRRRVEMPAYDPPAASVGSLPFPADGTVLSMDPKAIRAAAEQPIEGMLGTDFLGRYAVHIDFDRGELLFLKSAPSDKREILPMYWKPGGTPMIAGAVTGSDRIYFVIDTGRTGPNSGGLKADDAGRLLDAVKLKKIGDQPIQWASGKHIATTFRGIFLKVGRFSIEDPILDGLDRWSLLGLGFWSRFAVTFDFPGRRVLLSKGQNFKREDEWNCSGLWLGCRKDTVTIDHVSSESVGSAAGIRPGDILLKVCGLKAGQETLDAVRDKLQEPGRIECVVRRGDKEHRLTFNIPE